MHACEDEWVESNGSEKPSAAEATDPAALESEHLPQLAVVVVLRGMRISLRGRTGEEDNIVQPSLGTLIACRWR